MLISDKKGNLTIQRSLEERSFAIQSLLLLLLSPDLGYVPGALLERKKGHSPRHLTDHKE
jgi:hypothetical protein